MNQRNFIILGVPEGVEPRGVRCLSISERKVYEQMQRPKGSRWEVVESGIDITGQRMIDFLFKNDGSVDISGSVFESSGGGESMNKIMGHITCY